MIVIAAVAPIAFVLGVVVVYVAAGRWNENYDRR